MKNLLLDVQVKEKKCARGSWGAPKMRDPYLDDRLFLTEMNTLQLEVYYRYKRNHKKKFRAPVPKNIKKAEIIDDE